MKREGESRGFEPRKGIDYIVNYYDVLGVARDSSAEAIQRAFRKGITLYHEDKYRHLAPEFQQQAAFKTGILLEARSVLSDGGKRQTYDEQLENWKGPISSDGRPVISIGGSRARNFLTDSPESKDVLETTIEQARTMSGFNPTIFTIIEQQYNASDTPSSDIERAYTEALAQRNVALSIEDSIRREYLGLDSEPARSTSPSREYLAETADELSRGKTVLEETVAHTIFMLHSGEAKAIGPKGEEITDEIQSDPQQALAEYRKRAFSQYDEEANKITRLAEQKQELIEERLRILRGEYVGESAHSDKLIVTMDVNGHNQRFAFHLEDNTAQQIELPDADLEALDDPDKAREMIENGYSLMTVTHQEGLPIIDELQEAVIKHFESYSAEQE